MDGDGGGWWQLLATIVMWWRSVVFNDGGMWSLWLFVAVFFHGQERRDDEKAYFAVDFFHVVINMQFMPLRVSGNGS